MLSWLWLTFLQGVSNFAGFDELIAKINALIAQNDKRQKEIKRLEFDLFQVQKELSFYYSLSRDQNKIIKLNEKLHKRAFALLGEAYCDVFCSSLPDEWWFEYHNTSKKPACTGFLLVLIGSRRTNPCVGAIEEEANYEQDSHSTCCCNQPER